MPARPRVCIAIPLEDDLAKQIERVCETRGVAAKSRAELLRALADADGVLLSNRVRVDAELLGAAPGLRVVSGFGVGHDRFDLAEATRRGVAICNTPDVVTRAVVDLTLALILVCARRIFENAAYVRSGGWAAGESPPPLGFDVAGRTLGVVGFGRIGREVARRALAFGMRPVWNDVFRELPPGAPATRYLPLDELLALCDVVTLHVDLNPTSRHLIGERELARMKPDGFLVNTSRGEVVDQAALATALERGDIAGAALDVLEREPPDAGERIVALPNAIALPHTGTATRQTRRAMRELAVQNLLAMLRGETPAACLNPGVAGRRARRR